MKKINFFLLTLALFITPVCFIIKAEAGDGVCPDIVSYFSANVTEKKCPNDMSTTGCKWSLKLTDEEGTSYNSYPVIRGTDIYVVCRNVLTRIDRSGEILERQMLPKAMNSVCYMAYDEGCLYIPLSGGCMCCVGITQDEGIDADTMNIRWTSESFSGQSLSTVMTKDDYVYSATTSGDGKSGLFYCLEKNTGKTVWTFSDDENPTGYYWSGAVETAGTDKGGLVFGGDNAVLVSHSLSGDEVYDTFDTYTVTKKSGSIRSAVTYDKKSQRYFTTTNAGKLISFFIDKNGKFKDVTSEDLVENMGEANCTSTPICYAGRVYVCSYMEDGGTVSVFGADDAKLIYSISDKKAFDIKSSPFICTGYGDEDLYIYFTQNKLPGGVYYIRDSLYSETPLQAGFDTLFEPGYAKQYCMSNIVSDDEGTLYYSNDSGYLFALWSGEDRESVPSVSTPTVEPMHESTPETTPGFTTAPSPGTTPGFTTAPKTAKKPSNVRYSIRKKGKKYLLTLRWKKAKYSKKTKIVISGKVSKKKVISASRYRIYLKKGKYTIRLYGYNSKKDVSKCRKIKITTGLA